VPFTTAALSGLVLRRIMMTTTDPSQGGQHTSSGPLAGLLRVAKLLGSLALSLLSMFAPRNVPSLVYSVLSFFFLGRW
jgi:hypothetical protein